jgi:hypothetical protein
VPHDLLDEPRPGLHSWDQLDPAVSPRVVCVWAAELLEQGVGGAGGSVGQDPEIEDELVDAVGGGDDHVDD